MTCAVGKPLPSGHGGEPHAIFRFRWTGPAPAAQAALAVRATAWLFPLESSCALLSKEAPLVTGSHSVGWPSPPPCHLPTRRVPWHSLMGEIRARNRFATHSVLLDGHLHPGLFFGLDTGRNWLQNWRRGAGGRFGCLQCLLEGGKWTVGVT